MKKIVLNLMVAAVIVLVLISTSLGDDRRLDKSKLKLMTFNAEFLFDGVDPEGQADFPWKGSTDEARSHMAEIADVIKSANADIVNLVEVENLSVLEALNSDFLSGFNYKPYLVEGTDSYTRQDVGMLTRIDPIDGGLHRNEDKGTSGSVMKSVSKHYYTSIQVNGRRIDFIGIHLLAQPNNESRRLERQAQADAIQKLALSQYFSGSETVIWGDCNDYDSDCPDIASSMPISTVLQQLKDMDNTITTDNLVNVLCASQYPQSLRYTAWWDKNSNNITDAGEFTAIDHMLISPGLIPFLQSVEVVHNYIPADVSDHFPIVASFDFSSGGGPLVTRTTLFIAKVLSNPDGNESQKEAVWLTNPGVTDISLVGWKVRDKASTSWDLSGDGTISSGASKKIVRNGRTMSINNTGDVLELIDPNGVVASVVSFGSADPEEILEFSP
ncbi:MAG: lamin tail domain-containing protein [Nitrososphaera sp.]|jgi:exonuclease III